MRQTLSSLISRLRKGNRVSRLSRTDEVAPASSAEPAFLGPDNVPNVDFPGFAPAPSFKDRLRSALAAIVERARNNPRIILAASGGLLVISLVIIAVAFAFRPPKPVTPSRLTDTGALDILRLIPVPQVDPLTEESQLDRPRKDRYTEAEVAEHWLDLGQLPTEELREKNLAELRILLAAREKP